MGFDEWDAVVQFQSNGARSGLVVSAWYPDNKPSPPPSLTLNLNSSAVSINGALHHCQPETCPAGLPSRDKGLKQPPANLLRNPCSRVFHHELDSVRRVSYLKSECSTARHRLSRILYQIEKHSLERDSVACDV